MFGSKPGGANAYATVGVETGVVAASPHKLIVMLFEGALAAISAAQHHMHAGDIRNKGQSISKAITIVENGLRASLDKNVGGEIAANLDSLYDYISRRLLLANANNDQKILEETHRLLTELKDAWNAIDNTSATQAAAAAAAAPVAKPSGIYDALAPNTSRLIKA